MPQPIVPSCGPSLGYAGTYLAHPVSLTGATRPTGEATTRNSGRGAGTHVARDRRCAGDDHSGEPTAVGVRGPAMGRQFDGGPHVRPGPPPLSSQAACAGNLSPGG